MIWRCVICYVFVALTLKSLLSHINFAHSRSPDFRLVCGIDGCTKEYRVYNSFWYHIRRTHSQYLDGLGRSRSHRRERSASEPRRTVNSNNLWAYNVSGPTAVDTQVTQVTIRIVKRHWGVMWIYNPLLLIPWNILVIFMLLTLVKQFSLA